MFDRKAGMLFLYAVVPVHAGAAGDHGVVDRPIQREALTLFPFIQTSQVKGAIRDFVRKRHGLERESGAESGERVNGTSAEKAQYVRMVFGKPSTKDDADGGAASFTDARCLLFPVHTPTGVLAWVTCPLALVRLRRDLQAIGQQPPEQIPAFGPLGRAEVHIGMASDLLRYGEVILRREAYRAIPDRLVDWMARWLAVHVLPTGGTWTSWSERLCRPLVAPGSPVSGTIAIATSPKQNKHIPKRYRKQQRSAVSGAADGQESTDHADVLFGPRGSKSLPDVCSRLVVVSDEEFQHFTEVATEQSTRLKIDASTGAAQAGGLWSEEHLPAESLLYTLIYAVKPISAKKSDSDTNAVLTFLGEQLSDQTLRLGGNMAGDRGRLRTRWFLRGAAGGKIPPTPVSGSAGGPPLNSRLGLEPQRAQFAWQKLCPDNPTNEARYWVDPAAMRGYVTIVKGFGVNVRREGLVAALIFLLAKGGQGGGKLNPASLLCGQMEEWLCTRQPGWLGTTLDALQPGWLLHDALLAADIRRMRHITAELEALLEWLQRFAEERAVMCRMIARVAQGAATPAASV